MCADIIHGVEDKSLRVKTPTRILHITTRKVSCGENIDLNSRLY